VVRLWARCDVAAGGEVNWAVTDTGEFGTGEMAYAHSMLTRPLLDGVIFTT